MNLFIFSTSVRVLIACLAGILLMQASPAWSSEDDSWHEVRTEHFVVRTNAERERAVRLATDLEKYRFTVGYLSGLNTRDVPSVPVTVFAYKTADQYLDATGAYGTAGFYMPRPSGPISVLSLEDGEEDWQLSGKRVLFHEYTHHILHQYSPIEYPRWYDEGFAEFMATMEFDDGYALIGKPALHRVPFLKRVSDWIPSFELIDSKGRYMNHIGTSLTRDPLRGKGGRSLQYAQGWLMVHYLHSNARLQQGISRYLQEINRADVDDEKAFRRAFGIDYKRFDKELIRYWDEKEFASGRVEIASRLPDIAPEVRAMPPEEAAAIDYEALVLTGNGERISAKNAADTFQKCLEQGVRPIDMRLGLFMLALQEKDWTAAQTQVDALLDDDPKSAQGLTASVALQRNRVDGELERETALELRETAKRAILTDPTYVPALIQFADLTFEHDLEVDGNVTSVIDSIRFLAPDLPEGKVFEARLFAHQGALDEALSMLDEMIKWSSSTDQELQFKEIKKALAESS